jgi:hypothetical protein
MLLRTAEVLDFQMNRKTFFWRGFNAKKYASLVLPLHRHEPRQQQSIAQQFIFIEYIAVFIMAGGAQSQDASVGSPAPKPKGRATVDTLK